MLSIDLIALKKQKSEIELDQDAGFKQLRISTMSSNYSRDGLGVIYG